MLLDSSYLIDLEEELADQKFGPATAFANDHRRSVPRISIITVGELAAGGAADEAATRRFLSRYRVVSLKPQIALSRSSFGACAVGARPALSRKRQLDCGHRSLLRRAHRHQRQRFARVVRAGLPLKLLRY